MAIAFIWMLAATFHVTQGIWTSGWDDYLGDEVDGRLNNLLLEHGYQSLLGNYDFKIAVFRRTDPNKMPCFPKRKTGHV